MTLATTERAAICDAFAAAGPDRPTLCGEWTTRDLLAHLLVRERQPWASGGILVKALEPITEKAMQGYAATPWSEMIDALRSGPPIWSPFWLGLVDRFANAAEFFVHHEDVRRGEPGWSPRPPDAARDAEVWAIVKRTGRTMHRSSPVGVRLRTPDGREVVARPGAGVTVVGEPGELLLQAFGRSAVEVEIEGEPDAVVAFGTAGRGL
ncbi:TIGR03085 family metal-binding protein [Pseudonocardia sp. CA-107938]|uniref:TIGR03085 family metal-binding protein n=1 Tax=Pseudonocardia sp. CA-107938 TaxID=3240021 RepID=UPI003D950385